MIDEKFRSTAIEYSWKWFEYHGKQRMVTFNFYIIITGFVFAGYSSAFSDKNYLVSFVLSGFLIIVTGLFSKLDARNRHLVKLGENSFAREASIVAQFSENFEFRLVELAEKKPNGVWSYRKIIQGFFLIVTFVCLIGLAASVYMAFRPPLG